MPVLVWPAETKIVCPLLSTSRRLTVVVAVPLGRVPSLTTQLTVRAGTVPPLVGSAPPAMNVTESSTCS